MTAMKRFLFHRIDSIVRLPTFWNFIRLFVRGLKAFEYRRSVYEHGKAEEELKHFFSHKVVQTGFFAGLKYPSFQSVGSSIFPKILGSYEAELHHVFDAFSANEYSEIIDIGCAEGYYAVGLAMKFKNAKVYAFDIDEKATTQCRSMAKLNDVGHRVYTNFACSAKTLKEFQFTRRGLIICDCEGFEKELFDESNLPNLSSCDLIIETHLFYDPTINDYLVKLFKDTHKLEIICSQDDQRKLFAYKDILHPLSALARQKAVLEGRPFTMDWFIFCAKATLS